MQARKVLAPWLRYLLILAVAASFVEFILLRLLLRGGAFAPPGETIDRLFNILLTAGLAGLNFAFIATGLALALLAFFLLRGRATQRSLAILIWSLLAVGILLPFLLRSILPLVYQGLSIAVLVPLLLLHPRKRSWNFLGACAIAAALGSTYYFQASLNSAALGLSLPHSSTIFSGGELMAVAAPFLLLPGRRWRPWVVPLAALPAIAFIMASQSAIVSLAAVWTVYFTLFLPAPIYALALGAYTYDLADFLRDRPQRWIGVGLLLVGIAGRLFQNTYLAQLSLLGLILFILPASALFLGVREEAEPRASPEASGSQPQSPR